MIKALLPILALILAVGLVLSAAGLAAAQEPTIQLAVLIDGSGSITPGQWATQINGLAAAINDPSYIPRDGSVELTVIQFGNNSVQLEWGPQLITHVSLDDASNAVNSMVQMGGSTPLHLGINLAVAEMSPNHNPGLRQIINIATDGGMDDSCCLLKAPAEAARDAAIAAGIDEIDAEGIGDIPYDVVGLSDVVWLRDRIVHPQPGNEAPLFTPGWVYLVGVDADKFKEAIGHKIPRYTLTVNSSGGGSVSQPGEGDFPYTAGTMVVLQAVPDPGYEFVNWSGDHSGTANPDTVTMDSDNTVTANFSPESEEEGGGCFIATAAYGSYLDSHVETLRSFRDSYMVTNPVGKALVSVYYKLSPPVAEFIDDHPALKPIVRVGLLPAVGLSEVAVNTSSAQKAAMVGSLLLVSGSLIIWFRRKAVQGQ